MDKLEPKVIFEDDDILVVDKPAGMIVNNADTARDVYTLQDWVSEHYGDHYRDLQIRDDFILRAGIVHRLDKETSGILLVAKNREAFQQLQAQFKAKTVIKQYTALVHGKLTPQEGAIHVPVGRLPWDRRRFGVVVDGKESITEYRVREYLQIKAHKQIHLYSLVDVFPKTGRTHQIRVHMRYLGYAIAGDMLYAGRKNLAFDKKYLSRHLLHASHIEFTHPGTQERTKFETTLPEEFQSFLALLERSQ